MKTKTTLQQLKSEQHGKRFVVIAKQYPHGLHVTARYDMDQLEDARIIFRGQYNANDLRPWELGVALCCVSRYGRISWGLFEPLTV